MNPLLFVLPIIAFLLVEVIQIVHGRRISNLEGRIEHLEGFNGAIRNWTAKTTNLLTAAKEYDRQNTPPHAAACNCGKCPGVVSLIP